MQKTYLHVLLVALLVSAVFMAGRLSATQTVVRIERTNELVSSPDSSVTGAREANAYIEDCTLARAHAGLCAIPCGSDTDCL